MKADSLRKYTKDFLASKGAPSQNEIGRRAGIPTSTFSKFLSEKYAELTMEQEANLLAIVRPELSDVDVVAGKIKQLVVRRFPASVANDAILRLAEHIKKAV